MNKENIKFRGKSVRDGSWVHGCLIQTKHGSIIATEVSVTADGLFEGTWEYVHENSIGQYIGLKDKNGKEIYAGQILKVYHVHNDWTKYHWEVVFRCGAFQITKKGVIWSVAFAKLISDAVANLAFTEEDDDVNLKFFEVIGNIYDNPDLLESN